MILPLLCIHIYRSNPMSLTMNQYNDNQQYYYQQYYEFYPHKEHVGYYYNWIAPLQQWGLKWEPIKDTYCPPLLDNSLQWFHLAVPQGIGMIPLLGDGKMHCEKLAERIGATYIYYRHDIKKIEIWAQDTTDATTKMVIYLNELKRRGVENRKNLILKLK